MQSPFPADVAFVFRERRAGDEEGLAAALTPEERALLSSSATPKRVAEFALGRDCARAALRTVGAWPEGSPPPSILRKERAPLWPEGVVGTLAHSRGGAGVGAAVAAVARTGSYRGLGVDLERADREALSLARRILRLDERTALSALPTDAQRTWIGIAFSVKEAIFKAIHPATGVYLGFQDARALPRDPRPDVMQQPGGTLEWELLKACGPGYPAGMRGPAAWTVEGLWLATGVWISA